ncbi:hypothetical protein BS78_05G262600 [Paspalum vaginatum]|nr:hypothetical protein BS78_05G262600 [Paspalum vaginatum]
MGLPRLSAVQDNCEWASAGRHRRRRRRHVRPYRTAMASRQRRRGGRGGQDGRERASVGEQPPARTSARRPRLQPDAHRRCAASPPRLRSRGDGGGRVRRRCRTAASGRPWDGAALRGHSRRKASGRGDRASGSVGVVGRPRAGLRGGAAGQRSIRGGVDWKRRRGARRRRWRGRGGAGSRRGRGGRCGGVEGEELARRSRRRRERPAVGGRRSARGVQETGPSDRKRKRRAGEYGVEGRVAWVFFPRTRAFAAESAPRVKRKGAVALDGRGSL